MFYEKNLLCPALIIIFIGCKKTAAMHPPDLAVALIQLWPPIHWSAAGNSYSFHLAEKQNPLTL
jgi:hypothetical protein